MTDTQNRIFAVAATLFAALGSISFAVGGNETVSTSTISEGPLRCEIQTTPANGGIKLEGLAHADEPLSGSYRFHVVSTGRSGNSNIRQGGNFSVSPDRPATLGKMMLGTRGSSYKVELEITANGETAECIKHIDAAI